MAYFNSRNSVYNFINLWLLLVFSCPWGNRATESSKTRMEAGSLPTLLYRTGNLEMLHRDRLDGVYLARQRDHHFTDYKRGVFAGPSTKRHL